MKVSVIILNWNGRKLMERFMPALVGNTMFCPEEVEMVVADNASTDDSVEWLKRTYPQVRLQQFEKNYGFAEGYNRAIETSKAEYIVLLNSDVRVTGGWLSSMIDYMTVHTDVVACQPKLRSVDRPEYFEYAGAAGGYLDKYGYPFCRGRILNTIEKDNGQYDKALEVLWVTGACLCIRRKVYLDAGGLDSRFFAHMEEIDLCWRLRSRGYRLVCLPESVVYHLGGGTLPKDNAMKTYLNFRNNLLMLYKNLPEKSLKRVMRIRVFLDYVAAFSFLMKFSVADFVAVFRAHRDFHVDCQNFLEDRRWNLQAATGEKIQEIYPHSVLFDYYMKGKRKFCQLKFLS